MDLNALLGGITCKQDDHDFEFNLQPKSLINGRATGWNVTGLVCRHCAFVPPKSDEKIMRQWQQEIDALYDQWHLAALREDIITELTRRAHTAGMLVMRKRDQRIFSIGGVPVHIDMQTSGGSWHRTWNGKFDVRVDENYRSKRFPGKKDGSVSYDKVIEEVQRVIAATASEKAARESKDRNYKRSKEALAELEGCYETSSRPCVMPNASVNYHDSVVYKLEITGLTKDETLRLLAIVKDMQSA